VCVLSCVVCLFVYHSVACLSVYVSVCVLSCVVCLILCISVVLLV